MPFPNIHYARFDIGDEVDVNFLARFALVAFVYILCLARPPNISPRSTKYENGKILSSASVAVFKTVTITVFHMVN